MRRHEILAPLVFIGAVLGGCSSPGYQRLSATFVFSPDSTRVAYLTAIDSAGRGELTLQPVTGGSPVLVASKVAAGSFRFSSDGTQLGFVGAPDSTLFVAPVDGGSEGAIASEVGSWWFTPDGSGLVFEHQCGSTCALMISPTSGTSSFQLAAAVPPYVGFVGYSFDERQAVVWDASHTLWTVSLAGGPATKIAEGASGCRFTPDHRSLQFMVGHTLNVVPMDPPGRPAIALANGVDIGGALFDSGGARAVFALSPLTRTLFSVPAAGGTPTQIAASVASALFSPDGTQLALVINGDSNGFGTLETVLATGGPPTVVATAAGRASFSSDGARLLFSTHWDASNQSGLLEATAVSNPAAVEIARDASDVLLSPDGNQAAFFLGWDSAQQRGALATAPTGGGPLVHIASEASSFTFSPDGQQIGFLQNVHARPSSSLVGVGTLKIFSVRSASSIQISDQW